jgi:hypothetical protein
MHAAGSPGRAFKLSENALVERLERLPRWSRYTFGDTAGRRMILRTKKGIFDPINVLAQFYESQEMGMESFA